jgi:hypothetical protein
VARSVFWGSDGSDPLLTRVRQEYRELPALNVTFPQACRLWQLGPGECHRVLDQLLAEGVLSITADGLYVATARPSPRSMMARCPSRTTSATS